MVPTVDGLSSPEEHLYPVGGDHLGPVPFLDLVSGHPPKGAQHISPEVASGLQTSHSLSDGLASPFYVGGLG